jgi:hypothetical protein
MSTPAFSIPAAIRDRISALAQPRVWTLEDLPTWDRALRSIRPSTDWSLPETCGGLRAASTTPPTTIGLQESPPIPTRAM